LILAFFAGIAIVFATGYLLGQLDKYFKIKTKDKTLIK